MLSLKLSPFDSFIQNQLSPQTREEQTLSSFNSFIPFKFKNVSNFETDEMNEFCVPSQRVMQCGISVSYSTKKRVGHGTI